MMNDDHEHASWRVVDPFPLPTRESGLDTPGSSIFDLPTHHNLGFVVGRHHTPVGNQSLQIRSSNSLSYVIISGGTGCNSICSAFGRDTCYVLPISDDGGSSSEIIRVLGGPSIGDIRSRLIRLIPNADPDSTLASIRALLSHRLPNHERDARDAWRHVVEGSSSLWMGIPIDRKELIRGFLVYFESEILKRAHKNFSFLNGSIGNYFLVAAQRFFRSLPSAIFLFSSITNSQADILPVIVTNHTVTLAAELTNGSRIIGQCEISHPIRSIPTIRYTPFFDSPTNTLGELVPPPNNVLFESEGKERLEILESPISRIYYINSYGNEIHPLPNPDYIAKLATRDCLVYSCGSLWTSIMPCLALRGVGSAIATSHSLRAKVLLLNAKIDRETYGYSAENYINAIVHTLNAPYGNNRVLTYPTSAFITHLLYLRETEVHVDVEQITSMGVHCVEVQGVAVTTQFDSKCVQDALTEILSSAKEDGLS